MRAARWRRRGQCLFPERDWKKWKNVVAIENSLAVGHGNNWAEAVYGKDHFGFGLDSTNGDGSAKIEYLQALSMYCESSMTIN